MRLPRDSSDCIGEQTCTLSFIRCVVTDMVLIFVYMIFDSPLTVPIQ